MYTYTHTHGRWQGGGGPITEAGRMKPD